MPKYDSTLNKVLEGIQDHKKVDFLFNVTRQLINCLRIVHQAGFVYNDLKPDNVMVSFDSQNQMKVSLIDYNLISKRPPSSQKKPLTKNLFEGCLMFASLNQINFKETCPRDDLEALLNMMLVLLHGKLAGKKEHVETIMKNQSNP